jgi:hypothetical protein
MPKEGSFGTFSAGEIDNFIEYLETTLIPDLKDSGHEETASGFGTAVAIIDFLRVNKVPPRP